MTFYILWILTFYINLAYNRTYTRGLSRTHYNIYNTAFLWFSQRCPIVDVLLGSKYASAYIYIRVSLIEIILHIILSILNVFAVKYLFSYKGRNIWNWLNRIHLIWFILSDALKVKSNTNTPPRGAKKGLKRNKNSHISRKIVSLKVQANLLMYLWWSLL